MIEQVEETIYKSMSDTLTNPEKVLAEIRQILEESVKQAVERGYKLGYQDGQVDARRKINNSLNDLTVYLEGEEDDQ